MAQNLYDIDVNSLRYMADSNLLRLGRLFINYIDYYIGDKPNVFDMMSAIIYREMACKEELDDCEICFLSSKLNKEKSNELLL